MKRFTQVFVLSLTTLLLLSVSTSVSADDQEKDRPKAEAVIVGEVAVSDDGAGEQSGAKHALAINLTAGTSENSGEKKPVDSPTTIELIVVGPDGKETRQVIVAKALTIRVPDATDKDKQATTGTWAYNYVISDFQIAKDYRIGVYPALPSEALRAQLGLGEGKGVVINGVMGDSPAEEAGIKRHDVLLEAGDKELASVADLNKAVQNAGEKKLTLTLIRGGKRQTVDVRPEERKDEGQHGDFVLDSEAFINAGTASLAAGGTVDFVQPGVVVGRAVTVAGDAGTLTLDAHGGNVLTLDTHSNQLKGKKPLEERLAEVERILRDIREELKAAKKSPRQR